MEIGDLSPFKEYKTEVRPHQLISGYWKVERTVWMLFTVECRSREESRNQGRSGKSERNKKMKKGIHNKFKFNISTRLHAKYG
jgi:hypothetical protein